MWIVGETLRLESAFEKITKKVEKVVKTKGECDK